MINSRLWQNLARGWGLVVVCMLVLLVIRLTTGSGLSLQTNMLELLPEARRDALTLQAIRQHSEAFIDNVVFLIGAESLDKSQHLAGELTTQLQNSGLFSEVFVRAEAKTGIELYQFYQTYSPVLLTPDDRYLIAAQDNMQLEQRVLATMTSPAAGLSTAMLAQDPVMLFTNFIAGVKPYSGAFTFHNGMLSAEEDGRIYTLINATLGGSPFAMQIQKDFVSLTHALQKNLQALAPEAILLSAGMIRNVASGTEQAKREISVIGTGSLLGVLVLFLISFTSLRPLFYALIPISIGIAIALSVSLMVFNAIHIMTLVFGVSLIGVSIDYALHFFAEQSNPAHADTPAQSIARIMPGISLGLITSLIGYSAFFIAPFPGLQQMALFSFVGLLSAYCCVIFWFPCLSAPIGKQNISPSLRLAKNLLLFWDWQRRLPLPVAPLLIAAVAVAGIMLTHSNDDIRLLDNTPLLLKKERQAVERISALKPASQFFLIRGATVEQVLQREELLTQILNKQIKENKLAGFRAITSGLPSRQTQSENYAVLHDTLNQADGLIAVLRDIGFTEEIIEAYHQRYIAPPQWLELEQWQHSPLYNKAQWINDINGEYGSLVYIYGVNDTQFLRQLTATLEGVQWVDQVGDVTAIFSEYRHLANYLVCVAYICIFLILLWRYHLNGALRVILPPLLAAAFALAVAGFSAQPLTLFNTLALLLVLAIGIDYTVFFSENKGENISTMLGVILSAVTTILSFGLLALSSTPAIQSIGITVLCGITVALFLSPMAARKIN